MSARQSVEYIGQSAQDRRRGLGSVLSHRPHQADRPSAVLGDAAGIVRGTGRARRYGFVA